jgi:hypothetical protein
VKTKNGETWCQSHLADQQLHQLLEKIDADLAQEGVRQAMDLFTDSFAALREAVVRPRKAALAWELLGNWKSLHGNTGGEAAHEKDSAREISI